MNGKSGTSKSETLINLFPYKHENIRSHQTETEILQSGNFKKTNKNYVITKTVSLLLVSVLLDGHVNQQALVVACFLVLLGNNMF